jgi:hypothetical protein
MLHSRLSDIGHRNSCDGYQRRCRIETHTLTPRPQVYFILILYSYAAHLRSSTYHALPLTWRKRATVIAHPTTDEDLAAELEMEGASPEHLRVHDHEREHAADHGHVGLGLGTGTGTGAGSASASASASGSGAARSNGMVMNGVAPKGKGGQKQEEDDDSDWD